MKSQTNKAARALASAVSFFQQGKLKPAEGRLLAAIKLDPKLADAHNNLGVLYHHMGEPGKALGAFETALALSPDDEETARNLASAALALGAHRAALPALQLLVRNQPQSQAMRLRLAETFANLNMLPQAMALTNAMLMDAPADAHLLGAKAQLLSANGDHADALLTLREARQHGAEDSAILPVLATCLERARFDSFDPQSHAELLECFCHEDVESQALARAAGQLIRRQFEDSREQPSLDGLHASGWTGDALLRELLTRTVNIDATLEAWMVQDRRLLLAFWSEHGHLPEDWVPLAECLGLQCWINEYVWPAEPGFEDVRGRLTASLAASDQRAAADALRLWCLFAPPTVTGLAHDFADAPSGLGLLWRAAVTEPANERAIAADFQVGQLADEVSSAVRAQYEESPYPRWVELGAQTEEAPPAMLSRTFPAYRRKDAPPTDAILIAGCGSGHHALQVARQNPATPVVAIDLSIASLAHATRRSRDLGITNVEFKHLDLLNVAEIGRHFAVIESFGVLHHMQQPAAGLAALRSVLLPGGAIKLGLYSAQARTAVNAARARIEAQRLSSTPDDIRRFRANILTGKEPGLEDLLESSDLYSTSTCRDLLFHVHEHQFTPPELGAMLAAARLRFLGFQFANRSIPNRYASAYPDDIEQTSLANWHAFERDNPNTFARCFLFWAQAN